jgi:hypothetical protein
LSFYFFYPLSSPLSSHHPLTNAGLAAGPHYDPANTQNHGCADEGDPFTAVHMGDLGNWNRTGAGVIQQSKYVAVRCVDDVGGVGVGVGVGVVVVVVVVAPAAAPAAAAAAAAAAVIVVASVWDLLTY